jgi:hypothetical protein
MSKCNEVRLSKENKSLRSSLKECLELIDELSYLEMPLFEAELTRKFKLHYVHVVKTAENLLDKSR